MKWVSIASSFAIAAAWAAPVLSMAQTGLQIEQRNSAAVVKVPTVPPSPAPSFVVAEHDGHRVAQSRFRGESSAAPISGFSINGSTLVHTASGIAFPETYHGCRRGYIYPDSGESILGEKSALVEYDCPDQSQLSYVAIRVFRYDKARLSVTDAALIARAASQIDAAAPNIPCGAGQAAPGAPNADLIHVQCGGRWRKPSGDASAYGTATVAMASAHVFIGFTNSCVDEQCGNRAAFGAFIDGFDLTSMKRD